MSEQHNPEWDRLRSQALASGQSALERGDYAQARKDFDAVLRFDPENEEARAGKTAANYREHMQEGREALSAGEFEQAAVRFHQAQGVDRTPDAVFYENVARGRQALAEGNYAGAVSFFDTARQVNALNNEARLGKIDAYLAAGRDAEERKKWGEAESYYKALLREEPDNEEAKIGVARAREGAHRVRNVALWSVGGVLLIFALVALLTNRGAIAWQDSACQVKGMGAFICTPTATFTHTPTFTPTFTHTPTFTPTFTPTNTPTPTYTPTLTPTNTPTLTPTLTPTPVPVKAIAKYRTYIYDAPYEGTSVGFSEKGQVLFVCALNGDPSLTGSRLQVALTDCHVTKPWGWIYAPYVTLLLEGPFPAALTTPAATFTPAPAPTRPPAPTPQPSPTTGN
jgi:Tfp pilus assembly protein PilF